MMNRKRVFWATTALFTGLLAAGAASAQSSGTVATEATRVEDVVVTGARGPFNIEGTIVNETVPKTRATITNEYLDRRAPGQSIAQSLNILPGVNFTDNDPYGASGGNLRIRGFDSQRVSMTFDGMPLNDTGNYQIYFNQQLDSELIDRAAVNLGTTDVDSPTASASGGTINYTTVRPYADPSVTVRGTIGGNNFGRVFLRTDTGEFGPWGTTAFATVSYQKYDKWKGSTGELERLQYNGRLYQPLGAGNFFSLAGHYNRNRNAAYNNLVNLTNFNAGVYPENDRFCQRPVGVNGTAQNEANQSTVIDYRGVTINNTSLTNCTSLRINPSNTGNIRAQFSYGLTDSLRFTFDPSYQFTLATGGTTAATLGERDDRIDLVGGNSGGPGVDLNGDGDVLDTVYVYAPSITNTNRYGLTTSLIYDLNDSNRFRVAYTADYGRHRQTGEGSRLNQTAEPRSIWSSNRLFGEEAGAVRARDGQLYRFRDRFSIASLEQFAFEYRGQFLNDALTLNAGVRFPQFTRELNQYCYSQNGTSTVRCTTEAPSATLANGNVRFASTGTTEFVAPFSTTVKYEDALPNIGVLYRIADGHNAFISYAEGISLPRTDNLYQPSRLPNGSLQFSSVEPETTKSYDIGYRVRGDNYLGQVALWYTDYQNRIISSRDTQQFLADGVTPNPTFDQFIDRNLGAVKQMGVDAQIGWEPTDQLTLYLSTSYNTSEVQNDTAFGTFAGQTLFLPTKGKELVETPEWTFSGRVDWDPTENLSLGLEAKWVDFRWTTDVNDEAFPGYTVFDFDARYDLTETFNIRNAFVQFNVTNLFDEEYLGSISSGTNAYTVDVLPGAGVRNQSGSFRTGAVGAPRTARITIGTRF